MTSKKIFSFLLAVVMAFCATVGTAIIAFADDSIDFTYDEESATLTITGSGVMTDYGENNLKDRPWNSYSDLAKRIVISTGITKVGEYSFSRFSAITSVELPDSLETIGQAAFSGNDTLKSITVPDSVTEIGGYAFGYTYDMNLTDGFVVNCGHQSAAQKYCIENYVQFDSPMVGGSDTAHITYAGEQVMYSFVAPDYGTIVFYSTGTKDTCGLIYDADNYVYSSSSYSTMKKSAIAYGDDVGSNVNFKITKHLVKGKRYYLAAKFMRQDRYDGSESGEDGTFGVAYTFTSLDSTAYFNALAEYESILTDSSKYTADSLEEYKTTVESAKKTDFNTQTEIDNATATIVTAKGILKVSSGTVEFIVVSDDEYISNEKISFNYGDTVNLDAGSDKILKWTVTTQNSAVTTRLNIQTRYYDMVATEDATVIAYLQDEDPEVNYSKVTFVGKNNCVVAVKYIAEGESLDTSTVAVPQIPFYTAENWDKSTVVGTGEDIIVKAKYTFIDNDSDKCSVYYNGNLVRKYAYDSYVYISGADSKSLALAEDAAGTKILTYINTPEFYAPHRSEIYVVEVETMVASIGITGSYSQVRDDGRREATYNCKFYVPDDAEVVEYGAIIYSGSNSIKVRGESCSERNEYSIKLSVSSTSSVTSLTGKAYLTYKLGGETLTVYSSEVEQTV